MQHVIAIGASAGGLDALRRFFSSASAKDPFTYVVVQHLSPHHKSLMPELLSRHTPVTMHAAEDGQRLLDGHAYLLPPGFDMEMHDGALRLTPRQDDGSLHLPIDRFFSSLAAAHGANAAVVVLSGLGRDGTAGLRDIKAAGGLVAAQEPGTAQFDGMPGNAIATGLVDFVAPPEELLQKVCAALTAPPVAAASPNSEEPADPDALDAILWAVAKHAGVDFSDYKRSTLLRRIERRMRIAPVSTLAQYAERLADDAREARTLQRELLINVTRFFRDAPVFEHLREEVVPDLVRNARDGEGSLRIWSVGCATGEEAYSLALLVREAIDAQGLHGLQVKIFATDVDEDAVGEAGSGVFTSTMVSEIPDSLVARYFTRTDDVFAIQRSIRETVVFARHNALSAPPLTRMDLVLCRNLLIYLEPRAQQQLLRRLSFALHPGATLVLGSSETVGELVDHFEILDRRLRIYRSRGRMLPTGVMSPRRSWTPRRGDASTDRTDPLVDRARTALIEGYVPPALLIDDDLRLIHVFSSASDVIRLSPGPASLQIATVLPRAAAAAIGASVHRALDSQEDVLIPSLRLWPESQLPLADVRVRPLRQQVGVSRRLLVIFERPLHLAITEPGSDVHTADLDEIAQDRIRFLEDGLARTQARLQATIEELESSNEELQATNEELLSANEELQSTNEELQSVNEELHTVNAEYQNKIRELSDMNADMDNLFQSTAIGTIFLDDDLRVRRFTTAAAHVLPLLPRDLDRPISHFARHLPGIDLHAEARRVLAEGNVVEHEVRLDDGASVLCRVSAYVDGDGKRIGVVLNFVDISRLRTAEQTHAEVLDGLPGHIAVVDEDGIIRFVNQAWRRFAIANGAGDGDNVGIGASYLGSTLPARDAGDEHAARAIEGVSKVLSGELRSFTLEYPCHSPTEERWYVLRVAPLQSHGGAVVSHQDVTVRRLAQRLVDAQEEPG